MNIRILDLAEQDLIEGFRFYEAQEAGLGSYFITNLYADIESLRIYAGVHERPFKAYYRLLSRRFPFVIFLHVREKHCVHPCDPGWSQRSGLGA